MRFVSTRGGGPEVGFTQALLGGLAPDGGLYAPVKWPVLTPAEIGAFAGAPYAAVAADILARFVGDEISRPDLDRLCAEAYATFDHAAVAPLVQLAPDRFLLELFHGPTLAFKDVAMQILARLYEHVLAASGRTMTIVCATSGDTGGAAVEAFRGRVNVRIVALFPQGRISEVQRRFMTTALDANVRNVAVAGDFDDCQAIVKALFRDEAFVSAVNLSAVNSINFARIIAQSAYYFTAATALGAPERSVAFAVPTGNFGDAYAGWAARRMGLPIERITVATNANDILARVLQTGRYQRGAAAATMSPAMDIQVASNFERLYFEYAGRGNRQTAEAFAAFEKTGSLEVPTAALAEMRAIFTGVSASESQTAGAIKTTLRESGALVDPHTAVALAGLDRVSSPPPGVPVVVLSTAHAAKFPDAVRAACGVTPTLPAAARDLAARPERFDCLPAETQAVKSYVTDFAKA
jgi:threonine synthase